MSAVREATEAEFNSQVDKVILHAELICRCAVNVRTSDGTTWADVLLKMKRNERGET